MIDKTTAFFLAFAVMLATSALAASAVQAGQLDVGVQPASIFGHSEPAQSHILTYTDTKGNKFTTSCPTASFEGTTQGKLINEATVTATYGPSCTAFGVASQVLMNGCKYTITGSGHAANTATVDIVGCTAGKTIEKRTAICTLDIPEQNGLSHIVGTNVNAQQVTLSATISGITVRQTGAACPDGNNHVSSTGSFTGNTLVVARTHGPNFVVTEHNHQFTKLAQTGAQTTIAAT